MFFYEEYLLSITFVALVNINVARVKTCAVCDGLATGCNLVFLLDFHYDTLLFLEFVPAAKFLIVSATFIYSKKNAVYCLVSVPF